MEHDLNILMIFCIKKRIILTHAVYCWQLLQIYLCCLWLVSCSRDTHVITLCRCSLACVVVQKTNLCRSWRIPENRPPLRPWRPPSLKPAIAPQCPNHWPTHAYPSVHTALMCDTLSLFSAQYRQVKRGSLGAVTMSQLMKRQLEHQSSAPQNISTWTRVSLY